MYWMDEAISIVRSMTACTNTNSCRSLEKWPPNFCKVAVLTRFQSLKVQNGCRQSLIKDLTKSSMRMIAYTWHMDIHYGLANGVTLHEKKSGKFCSLLKAVYLRHSKTTKQTVSAYHIRRWLIMPAYNPTLFTLLGWYPRTWLHHDASKLGRPSFLIREDGKLKQNWKHQSPTTNEIGSFSWKEDHQGVKSILTHLDTPNQTSPRIQTSNERFVCDPQILGYQSWKYPCLPNHCSLWW